ncbi:MAG: hypothetical protein ACLSF2_08060 [Butyricicoccus sp.]
MASISIASADKSSLTDAQRKYLPKNGTILNISAQVQPKNGTATRIHALNGTASVSVAYSLKSGENAAHLVAYYLAEDGRSKSCLSFMMQRPERLPLRPPTSPPSLSPTSTAATSPMSTCASGSTTRSTLHSRTAGSRA